MVPGRVRGFAATEVAPSPGFQSREAPRKDQPMRENKNPKRTYLHKAHFLYQDKEFLPTQPRGETYL